MVRENVTVHPQDRKKTYPNRDFNSFKGTRNNPSF